VPEYLPIERGAVSADPHMLEAYAGEYELPEGRNPRISVVSVKDSKLYLDGIRLQAESETRFFGEDEATYIFVKDEQGQVREMIYDVGLFRLTAKKVK
jgi:hypothetical protein